MAVFQHGDVIRITDASGEEVEGIITFVEREIMSRHIIFRMDFTARKLTDNIYRNAKDRSQGIMGVIVE